MKIRLKYSLACFILLIGLCVESSAQKDIIKKRGDNDDRESNEGHHKHHDKDDDDDDDDNHMMNGKDEKYDKHEDQIDDGSSLKIINNLGFIHAFIASISVIVVSELGDKTFFIAAIMAMKHPRLTVYVGAMGALGLMTLLSALLGNIVTKIIPKTYTYYASSILFAIFGFKMLKEAYDMSPTDSGDEYEEAQAELRRQEEDQQHEIRDTTNDIEMGNSAGVGAGATTSSPPTQSPSFTHQQTSSQSTTQTMSSTSDRIMITTRRLVVRLRKYLSPIFLQSFILTFLAEWGDRSQISTIILGARENMAGTIIGGTLGHALCTGLAVIGGRMVAQKISVKTVTYAGAFVFLFFAFSALVLGPGDD